MEKDRKEITIGLLLERVSLCERLQREGICVGRLEEETWDKIKQVIKEGDKERLSQLRKELKDFKEPIIGC